MNTNTKIIYGPPGCGKTTHIIQSATNEVEMNGNRVLVTSLTRTAAKEIAERSQTNSPIMSGTLHSLAFQALNLRGNQVVDSSKIPFGDPWLVNELSLLRSSLTEKREWPDYVVDFENQYEKWKRSTNQYDFDDMLELAIEHIKLAPGQPDVMFVDEAQDHSALELKLARHWGQQCKSLVIVGDPDQCIFEFRGATPKFYEGVPESQMSTLSQSYRVPKKVLNLSVKWISKIPDRKPIKYTPRAFKGKVKKPKIDFKAPQKLITRIKKDIAKDKSVMVLATCNCYLTETINQLKKEGLIPTIKHNNQQAPDANPKLIVSTIHSAKGGEADHVYVFPNVAAKFWGRDIEKEHDAIHRLFYVAFTRAREQLFLLRSKGDGAIEWK